MGGTVCKEAADSRTPGDAQGEDSSGSGDVQSEELSTATDPTEPSQGISDLRCRARVGRETIVEDQATLEQLRGCNVVEGNLRLYRLDGLDLSPLADLEHVEGELTLSEFNELHALAGVETVQSLSLEHLAVTNLTPLSGLVESTASGAGLRVNQCNNLIDLVGLQDLSLSSLAVSENAKLRTLQGLSLRTEMLDVMIDGNPSLESLWAGPGSLIASEGTHVRRARIVSLSSKPAILDLSVLTTLQSAQELRLSEMPRLPVFSELTEVSILEVQYNQVSPNGTNPGDVSILPVLAHILPGANSGLLLIDNPGMTAFRLPSLIDTTTIYIRDNADLASVELPRLNSISDWLIVTCNPQLPVTIFDGMQQLVATDRLDLSGNLGSEAACDDI